MRKWIEIEKPDTVANNFKFLIESIICNKLESGECITFITKTTKEHDSLLAEYSSLNREMMTSYLDEMKQHYDFKIDYISDRSFIIRNIEYKELQVS